MIAIRNDGTVIIDTLIDTKGFSKGVNNMQSQLGGVTSSIKKLGAAIGAAFAVREVVRFGSECISLASDLEEVQNVVDVVFGGLSGTINQFANEALEAYGLSVTSAKKYTSTLGAMLKSMGLTTESAAEMSMQMTALAGDMASFYNLSADEAFEKIRSGISGETEPLKQLGINLSVANLEAFALAQGISKSYSAMTQQEQAVLRYNYLLRVTADAQGDFARTSGSWANQVRILSERFNQLKATLGKGFMAALTPVIKLLNTLLGYLQKVADAFAAVMGMLFGEVTSTTKSTGMEQDYNASVNDATVNDMDAVTDSYDKAANATDSYKDSTAAAAKEVKRSLAGFDELNKLMANEDYLDIGPGSENIGSVDIPSIDMDNGALAVPELSVLSETTVNDTVSPKIQAIVDKIKELIEPLKNIDLKPLTEAFERLKEALKPITKNLFAGLEWAWHNLLVPLAKWTIEDLLPAFLDLLSAALKFLNTVIEGLKPLAAWLWEKFLQPIASWTGGIIVDVINKITEALNDLSDWINRNQEGINNFIIILGSIAGAYGVVTTIALIAQAIKDVIMLISGASIVMSPLTATIVGWITKIGTFFATVGAKVSGLFSLIGTALGYIASALGISVGWVAAIVAAVAAAVAAVIIYWDELVVWAQNIGQSLNQLWQNIIKWIEDVKAKYEELKQSVIKWAKDTSKAINDQFIVPIKEWFNDLMTRIRELFENAKSDIQNAFEKAATFIDSRFVSPVIRWMYSLGSEIARIYEGIRSNIVRTMESAGRAIEQTFIEPIGRAFKNLGDRIHNTFRSTRERISQVFQSLSQWFQDNVTTPIYRMFDNMVGNIISGLNELSRAIAQIFSSFNSTKSAVSSYSSSRSSYSSYAVSAAQVPYLARGAVIPANSPFLAVLGDQRRGTNVEAPLSTIQEAVALVMNDVIQSNMVGFEAIVSVLQEILETILGIEVGDQVIAEAVQRYQSKMSVVRGG